MNWQTDVLALLASSLVRPLGLAAVVWMVLRVLNIRHPASRHAAWTAVLIGMLLLPVVSLMTPRWKLRVLPRAQAVATASTGAAAVEPDRLARGPLPRGGTVSPVKLETVILWVYFAGLFAMVVYRVMGWALLCRVIARSQPLRSRRLRESSDVLTPVAVGVLRPLVILPVGWREWSPATREAVLAHEFAHLRRNDVLVASMARAVQCVFWFHPLAWWISRQVTELAELSCDAAALERTGDAAGYARILVDFAGRVNAAGQRVALPGLAMAASSGISRRVDQVFELSGGTLRKLARPGLSLVLLGVPVVCLAATVVLAEQDAPAQQTPAAGGPYVAWLTQDVAYIITDAERAAFKALTSDPEREKFIEQFWLRRDPTPGTPANEFKEEHYRRIAWTNEHFRYAARNLPGWKTDRGRIYITYGPPDQIETHPSGGDYQRPASEGGGTVAAYPFEQWRYRYIENVGKDVIIEFVDPTMTGEFRMTLDPNEKTRKP
jgi:GWxTD domain-containing protein